MRPEEQGLGGGVILDNVNIYPRNSMGCEFTLETGHLTSGAGSGRWGHYEVCGCVTPGTGYWEGCHLETMDV